jgi:DedD protein
MAERQQDIETLKRRGRRRLVGAVALVLAAVIVLPMVFDPEPKRSAPPVSVRIPGEDEAPFKPKAVPKPPEKKPAEKKIEEKAEAPPPPLVDKPEEKKPAVAKPAPAKPAAPKPVASERARAEAALAGMEYVVQVGVFADPAAAVDKLKAAKVPYYTEALANNLTRVRAGPFPSKEAAEKARERLKGLGLEPGPAATKSG